MALEALEREVELEAEATRRSAVQEAVGALGTDRFGDLPMTTLRLAIEQLTVDVKSPATSEPKRYALRRQLKTISAAHRRRVKEEEECASIQREIATRHEAYRRARQRCVATAAASTGAGATPGILLEEEEEEREGEEEQGGEVMEADGNGDESGVVDLDGDPGGVDAGGNAAAAGAMPALPSAVADRRTRFARASACHFLITGRWLPTPSAIGWAAPSTLPPSAAAIHPAADGGRLQRCHQRAPSATAAKPPATAARPAKGPSSAAIRGPVGGGTARGQLLKAVAKPEDLPPSSSMLAPGHVVVDASKLQAGDPEAATWLLPAMPTLRAARHLPPPPMVSLASAATTMPRVTPSALPSAAPPQTPTQRRVPRSPSPSWKGSSPHTSSRIPVPLSSRARSPWRSTSTTTQGAARQRGA